MSYGVDSPDLFRQTRPMPIVYSGAKNPSICQCPQPTKFELVINLKSAATLGLTVPSTLLATADEVID
jgi:putative ABC transport system substrate-binding protein